MRTLCQLSRFGKMEENGSLVDSLTSDMELKVQLLKGLDPYRVEENPKENPDWVVPEGACRLYLHSMFI